MQAAIAAISALPDRNPGGRVMSARTSMKMAETLTTA